jgi:hypothetical protein
VKALFARTFSNPAATTEYDVLAMIAFVEQDINPGFYCIKQTGSIYNILLFWIQKESRHFSCGHNITITG